MFCAHPIICITGSDQPGPDIAFSAGSPQELVDLKQRMAASTLFREREAIMADKLGQVCLQHKIGVDLPAVGPRMVKQPRRAAGHHPHCQGTACNNGITESA